MQNRQDKNWYREVLTQKKKNKKNDDPVIKALYNPKEFRGSKKQYWKKKEEKKRLRISLKKPQLHKKESFLGLMVRACMVLAGCWAIIEMSLRLKV